MLCAGPLKKDIDIAFNLNFNPWQPFPIYKSLCIAISDGLTEGRVKGNQTINGGKRRDMDERGWGRGRGIGGRVVGRGRRGWGMGRGKDR